MPNAALRFAPPKGSGGPGAASTRPSGGLVGMLLPRRPPEDKHQGTTGKGRQQRVWVLRDGGREAVPVVTGATDGVLTQVLEGTLEPGTEVLVDTLGGGR